MKPWRPKNWREIFKHNFELNTSGAMDSHFQPATGNERRYYTGGHEDGANSILEALKASEGSHRILPQDNDYLSNLYPNQRGWLVFITDDNLT